MDANSYPFPIPLEIFDAVHLRQHQDVGADSDSDGGSERSEGVDSDPTEPGDSAGRFSTSSDEDERVIEEDWRRLDDLFHTVTSVCRNCGISDLLESGNAELYLCLECGVVYCDTCRGQHIRILRRSGGHRFAPY